VDLAARDSGSVLRAEVGSPVGVVKGRRGMSAVAGMRVCRGPNLTPSRAARAHLLFGEPREETDWLKGSLVAPAA